MADPRGEARGARRRWPRALGLWLAGSALLLVPVLNLIPVGFVFARMGERARTGATGELPLSWRALRRYFRLGLAGCVGSGLVLAVPGAFFSAAWVGGWIFSYEGVGAYGPGLYAMGFLLACASMLTLVPALVYLPAAQAHFAAEQRLAAMFEVAEVLRTVRARPWSWALAVAPWVLFFALFGVSRIFYKEGLGVHPAGALAPNLVTLAAATWIKDRWALLYHRASGARAAADRPRVGPVFAVLVLVLVHTALRAALMFLVSFKLWDSFHDPLLMIPAVPYPGGAFGLGE